MFPVVGEFGRIAVEFLRKGSNPKIYEGAASKKAFWTWHVLINHTNLECMTTKLHASQGFLFFALGKLNVSAETVQHGVEGLVYLLTESSKLMVGCIPNYKSKPCRKGLTFSLNLIHCRMNWYMWTIDKHVKHKLVSADFRVGFSGFSVGVGFSWGAEWASTTAVSGPQERNSAHFESACSIFAPLSQPGVASGCTGIDILRPTEPVFLLPWQ